MKKSMKYLSLIAVLFMAVSLYAGSGWTDADGASPLLVRYLDNDHVGTITVAAGVVTATDDGTANALSFDAAGTLDDVLNHINSATNASGEKNFQAMYWAGIAADSCLTNYLVVAAATTIKAEWNDVILWDTSNCLHYDCVGSQPSPSTLGAGTAIGGFNITKIFGEPTGTGDITVSVYVGGNRKYLKFYESPVYVLGVAAATNVASTYIAPEVDLDEGIAVPPYQVAFVRMACASSATTGGCGMIKTNP